MKSRVYPILMDIPLTASTGNALTTNNLRVSLPSGIIVALNSELDRDAPGTALPLKGQLYMFLMLSRMVAGNKQNQIIMSGYVYAGNDLHWVGEIPVEEQDNLQVQSYNTFAVPAGKRVNLHIRGTLVKALETL